MVTCLKKKQYLPGFSLKTARITRVSNIGHTGMVRTPDLVHSRRYRYLLVGTKYQGQHRTITGTHTVVPNAVDGLRYHRTMDQSTADVDRCRKYLEQN